MKLLILFLWLVFSSTVFGQHFVSTSIDWENYIRRYDMVWNAMPDNYYEGAYVGNGLLGTVVFLDTKNPNNIRFEIGRSDVYDHRPDEFAALTKTMNKVRLPIGQIILSPCGKIKSSHMKVSLWNAELTGKILTDKGEIEFMCYVPLQEEFIVLKVKGGQGEEGCNIDFRPQQGNCSRAVLRPSKGQLYIPNPPFEMDTMDDDIHVVTQPLLAGSESKARWNDIDWLDRHYATYDFKGDDYATAWVNVCNKNIHTVYLTVANRWAENKKPAYGSKYDAVETIRNALKKDGSTVQKRHRAWWHSYYPASFLTIPDESIESYYWLQMYRLASAGQIGRPVIDLMGPWYKPTVWPSLWINLNAQLTYFIWGVTNHLDLEDEFYRLLDRHADVLCKNVPVEFQADCSAVHNPLGFDDLSGNVFLTEDSKSERPMNLIVLPWWVQMYYVHNRRTMDEDRLREKLYPLMKRTFAVYQRILYKGDDGKLHLPLTFSDEYGNDFDVNMNLALAKWGFKTLIECAIKLNVDHEQVKVWQSLLDNMTDYQVGKDGFKIGRTLDFDRPHRHFSHLFNIFPLYEIDIERNPELKDVMVKSVAHYANRENQNPGENCMYKYAGAASLWAALGDGNQALANLTKSLVLYDYNRPTATSNGFYSELGWPTFESPIASCRALIDLLFQSHNGIVRIFPAMPSGWRDASFKDFRAEGGFSVTAVRKEGKTLFVEVHSSVDNVCRLKVNDFQSYEYLSSDISVKPQRLEDGIIEIQMRKGMRMLLYDCNVDLSALVISPLSHKGCVSPWGGK